MSEPAPPNLGVILIATEGALDELSAALLADGIQTEIVASGESVASFISSHERTVAVLDTAIPQAENSHVYNILRQNQSIPTLILVPTESYRTYLLDPLRGPNEEYVAKPVDNDELVLRVKALMIRAGIRPTLPTGTTSSELDIPPAKPGKIVTVFHAKGGVGGSTVASNLAVGLTKLHKQRTLLVDADLWFGDLAVLMNVPPKQSLFELVAAGETDVSELRRALIHHQTGIYLLLRPEDPSIAEQLDPNLVSRAITAYRAMFDYVIVDSSPGLSELMLQILDLSEQILLVTTPELTAVHNSARFLNIAQAIGYLDRVSVIVNRANSGIPTELLEQHLNVGARVRLPSAGRLVVDAANRGVPLLATSDPEARDEITRALIDIVELVRPEGAAAEAASAPPTAARPRTGRFFWR